MPGRPRRNPIDAHPSLIAASLMQSRTSPQSARALGRAPVVVRSFDEGGPIARPGPGSTATGSGECDVTAANPGFDALADQQFVIDDIAPISALPGDEEAHATQRPSGAPPQSQCPPAEAAPRRTAPANQTPAPAFLEPADAFLDPTGPSAETGAGEAALATQSSRPKAKPRRVGAFSARQMDKLIEDNDFKADIGAILGKDTAPAQTPPPSPAPLRSGTRRGPSLHAQPRTGRRRPQRGPSEHAIFDKILPEHALCQCLQAGARQPRPPLRRLRQARRQSPPPQHPIRPRSRPCGPVPRPSASRSTATRGAIPRPGHATISSPSGSPRWATSRAPPRCPSTGWARVRWALSSPPGNRPG